MKPPWVDAMRPRAWYRISGDEPQLGLAPTRAGTRYLADNDPARDPLLNPARTLRERLRRALGRAPLAPWSGRVGFAAVTEAWNGAVLAKRFGRSGAMIVFGGGHADYFGSDVHAFDLENRVWSRLCNGFTAGTPEAYGDGAFYPDGEYPDGSPLPPHTYGYIQYDPVGHTVILPKSALELGKAVRSAAIPHLLDLGTLRWRRGPRHPGAVLDSSGWSAWDSERRVLWTHSGDDGGGNAFVGFSPDGVNADGTVGHWRETFANKLPGEANHNAMTFDPVRRRLVLTLAARNGFGLLDPERPGHPVAPLRLSGRAPRVHECAALEYAPNLEAVVYYSAAGGPALYALAAPRRPGERERRDAAWTCEALHDPAAGLDPVADAARGAREPLNRDHTFGRFRVASWGDTDVAVLVRHVDSPVYAFRLT